MKEYNEQVVETLDDAGCIIANKNIIIDNLQARIAELEADRDQWMSDCKTFHREMEKREQQSNDRLYEEREIWDRVMGDGVKKLERLELELDDCLYVLESLWDKTCNKEVTEKWAGILIRNKRGIGASSAEDSSEQTTA